MLHAFLITSQELVKLSFDNLWENAIKLFLFFSFKHKLQPHLFLLLNHSDSDSLLNFGWILSILSITINESSIICLTRSFVSAFFNSLSSDTHFTHSFISFFFDANNKFSLTSSFGGFDQMVTFYFYPFYLNLITRSSGFSFFYLLIFTLYLTFNMCVWRLPSFCIYIYVYIFIYIQKSIISFNISSTS